MNLRHSNERFTFLKIPKICSIKTLLMCTIFSASINFILINLQIFHKGRGSAPYKGLGCPILPPDQWSDHKLFIITPTKQDWNQIADLTRLSQTLRLVGNVHWIVVEDDFNKSISVQHILQRSCHSYTHITHPVTNETGDIYRKTMGMLQRNAGLEALRKRYVLKSHDVVMDSINNKEYPSKEVGTVFFAYQDCTYDSKLFVFMRHVTTVGVWAVGLVGGTPVEHPVVRNDTVVGWNVKDRKQRKFATDIVGFAVNLDLILQNENAWFGPFCKEGEYESCFIEQLNINLTDLQPFGFQDMDKIGDKWRVYAWHTKTAKAKQRKINSIDFQFF